MPRIQDYNRQVSVTGQGPSAPVSGRSAAVLGNVVANAGENLQSDILAIAHQQEKMRKQDVHDRSLVLGDTFNRALLDFEVEETSKLGEKAYGSQERVDKWANEFKGTLLRDVTDPDILKNLNHHIEAKSLSLKDTLAKHEAGQRKVVGEQTILGSLSTQSKAAYQQSGTLEENLEEFRIAVLNSPTLSAEEKENKLITGESAIAESRLNGLIIRNPGAARDIVKSGVFNQYLDKNAMERIDAKIKSALVDETHMKGVDLAVQIETEMPNATELERREAIRKKAGGDKDLYTAAIAELAGRDAIRDEQKKEIATQTLADVETDIAAAREKGKVVVGVKDVDPRKWAALKQADPVKAQALLKEWQSDAQQYRDKQRARDKETREEKESRTLETYVSLMMSPDLLMKTDLTKAWKQGDISDSQYKSLGALKREVNANPDKREQLQSDQKVIGDIAKNAKLKQGTPEYDGYLSAVTKERIAFKSRNDGRDMTQEELTKMARNMLYKVDVKGSVFDKPVYRVTFAEIPDKYKRQIIDRFKAKRFAYTEQDILDVYIADQTKGKP